MSGNTLSLDTILSATFYFTTKWSSHLQSNKARDLLRYLVCRLYDQGRGNFSTAHLTLAQTTLARKMGVSRQWIGELVERLDTTGWIAHASPKLPDGTNGSTIFTIGPQFQRLLIMLTKSKQRKIPVKSDAKHRWHFSPSKEEEKIQKIRARENMPPSQKILDRMPLLKKWMARGKAFIEDWKDEDGSGKRREIS
jgi:hypothetical protein